MATSIRLAPELVRRLDRLAAKTGRTKAFHLREMIEEGISEMGVLSGRRSASTGAQGAGARRLRGFGKERPWRNEREDD
ncbi:MAG: ribbon-helix-helix protein, CopG family [Terracidiphilus sp.]